MSYSKRIQRLWSVNIVHWFLSMEHESSLLDKNGRGEEVVGEEQVADLEVFKSDID